MPSPPHKQVLFTTAPSRGRHLQCRPPELRDLHGSHRDVHVSYGLLDSTMASVPSAKAACQREDVGTSPYGGPMVLQLSSDAWPFFIHYSVASAHAHVFPSLHAPRGQHRLGEGRAANRVEERGPGVAPVALEAL